MQGQGQGAMQPGWSLRLGCKSMSNRFGNKAVGDFRKNGFCDLGEVKVREWQFEGREKKRLVRECEKISRI